MALIYTDPSIWATLSNEEIEETYGRYRALTEEAKATGVYADGAQLGSTTDATTVRIRDRETLVTDGPYAEVKEVLGGYYVFDVGSLDEALDWAAKIPGAERGAIEVRAMYVEDQGGEAA